MACTIPNLPNLNTKPNRRSALAGLLVAAACLLAGAAPASAGTVPSGFQDTVALSGLTQPTNLSFAPDGRIFVSEKSGVIKEFDDLSDNTPTIVADLPHGRLQLLGPRAAGHGSRPPVPDTALPLRPLHARCRARRELTAVGDARR